MAPSDRTVDTEAMARLPTSDVAAIGQRIVWTREAFNTGLSQAAFARALGVSPQTLSNCENGLNRPSIDLAAKICQMTGVTLDWIYFGDRSSLPLRIASRLPTAEAESRHA
jgi:DNA-binding XRE family transcriptional regulator